MYNLQKLQKWVETINTYYAFALLLYAVALFIASHTHLFLWVVGVVTPIMTGWGGYLLYGYLEQRNQRYGFRIISDVMSYEIGNNNRYTLRYTKKLRATTNHLMVYPIGYQWSGSGEISQPKLSVPGQQLLSIVSSGGKRGPQKITPYRSTDSSNGDWLYSFVALNPPLHKNAVIDLKYSQEFHDKKGQAQPYLYYFVRIPMDRLELSVKFPASKLPKVVTSSYIKPSDPNHPYLKAGVEYDANKQWATWVIEKPKRGYCYRIHWE